MGEIDLLVRVDDHGYALNGAGFKFAMRRVVWHSVAELQAMGFRGTFELKGHVLDEQGTTESKGSSKGEADGKSLWGQWALPKPPPVDVDT